MKRLFGGCLVLGLFLGGATQARSAVIWDFSPATTGVNGSFPWQNQSALENFAEHVVFANAVQITGMDIYTWNFFAGIGQPVTIRLWADAAGTPGALLNQFVDLISVMDTVGIGALEPLQIRVHVDFTTPLALAAGTTYWIGMSGPGYELGQVTLEGLNPPDDNQVAVFDGTVFNSHAAIGDMAFRLHDGTVSAVPEPTSLAMFAVGALGMIGYGWKRRRK